LAQRTGRTKSYYARELIEGNMEDLEDRYLAEARLEKRRPSLTSRQVRKDLGLDVDYDPRALKDLKKLDRTIQREILDYMDFRVARRKDARDFGKPLRASKFGLWRYRVRDYRIICELQEKSAWSYWSWP
jgi:mRNA interferase RelE/StbE